MIAASGILACLMVGTFILLYGAIAGLRDSERLTDGSQAVLASVNQLERLIVDLETGQRGYVITGNNVFLDPWKAARAAYPGEKRTFQRLADRAGSGQGPRAAKIVRDADSYVNDYSVPLVARARQNPGAKQPDQVTTEGKQRVDALRAQFDEFVAVQRGLASAEQKRALSASREATITAAAAAAGSLILIFLFTAYLTRAIVRPVRRAALMAGGLAGGDLTVRMPETSLAEIGTLEHAFNTMAGSLQVSHDRLRKVAADQAALRRVATLVARAVSPQEVFEAVAGELGRILGADFIVINRFETNRMETVVGSWKRVGHPEAVPPVGSHWSLEGRSLESKVLRTELPARTADYEHATSGIGVWARTRGIKSGIGSPVVVEGRLWGVIIAFSAGKETQPVGTEERMLEFTELVGTALANAESRAKLTAARARLVAASDETRRRIERDLHDGAQQRLVSLGLELRAAEAAVPEGQELLKEQLSATVRGLTGVLEDLQEISRGLHPAILSRAGLEPALKALARRAGAPVELSLHIPRLDERLEVAIYYIVSEAVTNAIKHAQASTVWIELRMDGTGVRLSVRDDGVGGADVGGGSGLIGLKDRVEALSGTLDVQSPSGEGTTILVHIPIWAG